jgi:hypothetical protein
MRHATVQERESLRAQQEPSCIENPETLIPTRELSTAVGPTRVSDL